MKTPNQIRRDIVHMAHYSHASHIGAALSCVDILYAIYKYVANITPENITSTNRDRVILSKGHASIALYSVLAELGLMDKSLLDKYYINGGISVRRYYNDLYLALCPGYHLWSW